MTLSQYIGYSLRNRKGTAEFLVALAWASPLLSYVKAITLRLPFGEDFSVFVVPLIFIFLFVIGAKYLMKSFRPNDLVFALFLISIYLLQFIGFPENEERLLEFFSPLLLSLIPMYFIGTATDINQVYKPMYVMSIICVLLQAVNTFFLESSERMAMTEEEISEQMNIAYRILPYVVFCFWGWLRKFDIIGFITSLIGLFLLVSFGSRGPVACTLLFIVLYIIFYKSFKGKWIIVSLLGVIVAFALVYLEQFFLLMQGVLSQYGLSTRIINLAINEEVATHVSGRDVISGVLMRQLQDAPFFGYGIGGTWKFVGGYAHNIFLDVFISFGKVPGGIMLIALFFIFFKGWRSCRTVEEKGFMLVLFCCFAKLFISYTLFQDSSWMLMLGFCVGILRRKKRPVLVTNSKQITGVEYA